MRDVDKYPHILDTTRYVWHRRPANDTSDGPHLPDHVRNLRHNRHRR